MTIFRVGMKVVLANPFGPVSSLRAIADGVVLPAMGEVYTIREFDPDESCFLCIRLSEITNGPDPVDGIEPSFQASLFRPVVERKTDISTLTALLTPSKIEELA